jgi:hypothetical protein
MLENISQDINMKKLHIEHIEALSYAWLNDTKNAILQLSDYSRKLEKQLDISKNTETKLLKENNTLITNITSLNKQIKELQLKLDIKQR